MSALGMLIKPPVLRKLPAGRVVQKLNMGAAVEREPGEGPVVKGQERIADLPPEKAAAVRERRALNRRIAQLQDQLQRAQRRADERVAKARAAAAAKLAAVAERRAKKPLTQPQQLVRLLRQQPGLSVAQMSAKLGIGMANCSVLMPALARQGVVRKDATVKPFRWYVTALDVMDRRI